jgi:hypothetical protein
MYLFIWNFHCINSNNREILMREKYSNKVDMWSLGIILLQISLNLHTEAFAMLIRKIPAYPFCFLKDPTILFKLLSDVHPVMTLLISKMVVHHSKRSSAQEVLDLVRNNFKDTIPPQPSPQNNQNNNNNRNIQNNNQNNQPPPVQERRDSNNPPSPSTPPSPQNQSGRLLNRRQNSSRVIRQENEKSLKECLEYIQRSPDTEHLKIIERASSSMQECIVFRQEHGVQSIMEALVASIEESNSNVYLCLNILSNVMETLEKEGELEFLVETQMSIKAKSIANHIQDGIVPRVRSSDDYQVLIRFISLLSTLNGFCKSTLLNTGYECGEKLRTVIESSCNDQNEYAIKCKNNYASFLPTDELFAWIRVIPDTYLVSLLQLIPVHKRAPVASIATKRIISMLNVCKSSEVKPLLSLLDSYSRNYYDALVELSCAGLCVSQRFNDIELPGIYMMKLVNGRVVCLNCAQQCHSSSQKSIAFIKEGHVCECRQFTSCQCRKKSATIAIKSSQGRNVSDISLKSSSDSKLRVTRLNVISPKSNGVLRPSSVISSVPIAKMEPQVDSGAKISIAYFEVDIQNGGTIDAISIGLTSNSNYPSNKLPGFIGKSIGVHGDDGELYNNSYNNSSEDRRSQRPYVSSFVSGDVIGCGLYSNGEAYFTRNRVLLPPTNTVTFDSGDSIYAVIGLVGERVRFTVNFGSKSFVFSQRTSDKIKSAVIPEATDIIRSNKDVIRQAISKASNLSGHTEKKLKKLMM